MAAATKQLRRWAFTLKKQDVTPDAIQNLLREAGAKRWAFQEEKAVGGYEHYQGRVSFKAAKRINELKLGGLPWHWSIESSEDASTFYALKEETRVSGPYTDKIANAVPPYIPRKFRGGEDTLKPWQRWVLNRVRQQDDRKILFLVDTTGGVGKSFLGAWIALRVPGGSRFPSSLSSTEDFLQAAMAKLGATPDREHICVLDVPRSIIGDPAWFKFCSALEELKNGQLFDKRYSWKETWIESPKVLVFSNRYPPRACLSADRFDIVDILWARFACGELSRAEYEDAKAEQRRRREELKKRVSDDVEQESDDEPDQDD